MLIGGAWQVNNFPAKQVVTSQSSRLLSTIFSVAPC